MFGLFAKKIRLPLEAFIDQTMLAFVPAGGAITSEQARTLGLQWASQHADEHARAAVERYLGGRSPELVVIDVAPPAPMHSPDALDPWCWDQADDRARAVVRDAALVITVGSGDIPGGPLGGIASATAVATAVAEHTGGVVFDPAANVLLHPGAVSRPLSIEPKVTSLIRWFSTVDRRMRGTMSTRGLFKVGLKGILWTDYPAFLERPVAVVANTIAQHLANAVFALGGDRDPPAEIVLPAEIELTYADVQAANGSPELAPSSPSERGRTRIGLVRDGNRAVVIPPTSYRGAREEWEKAMLAELLGLDAAAWALEAGRAVIDPSQHPPPGDRETESAIAAIGEVAIVTARKNT
jgi:hypothetical protein